MRSDGATGLAVEMGTIAKFGGIPVGLDPIPWGMSTDSLKLGTGMARYEE